mgnify:CR=1 FL=1
MRISELIAQLQALQAEHGDIGCELRLENGDVVPLFPMAVELWTDEELFGDPNYHLVINDKGKEAWLTQIF